MSITTKPAYTTFAVLVQMLSVGERCLSTKRTMELVYLRTYTMFTCGSTASLGGGLGPLFRLVGLHVLIGFLVAALTLRLPDLWLLRGMHAHTVEVQPVRHRSLHLTRTVLTLIRHTLIRHTLIRRTLIHHLLCTLTPRIHIPHLCRILIRQIRIVLLIRHHPGVILKWITCVT